MKSPIPVLTPTKQNPRLSGRLAVCSRYFWVNSRTWGLFKWPKGKSVRLSPPSVMEDRTGPYYRWQHAEDEGAVSQRMTTNLSSHNDLGYLLSLIVA